ncbi:hypothetical protein GYB22_07700 [bacterium]|nr:hypothetical protein [bacterium]
MVKNILLIINLYSGLGRSKNTLPAFKHFLQKHSIEYFPYTTTGDSDSLTIRRILSSKSFDAISILGGDGTINMVLNSLEDNQIPIHIIPCGLGNDLAKTIHGTKQLDYYFKCLIQNRVTEIDTYQCNNRRFSVTFGLGFDGAVSYLIQSHRKKWIPRKLLYWITVLRIIFTYKEVEIEIDEEKKTVFLLSLANTPYLGGGFKIAPHADISDTLLDSVLIGKVSNLRRILNVVPLRKGKHLHLPMIEYKKISSAYIHSDQKIPAHVDGELIESNTYSIKFDRKVSVLS